MKLPPARSAAFALVAACLTLALMEAASWCAFFVVDGESFGYQRLQAQRQFLSDESVAAVPEREALSVPQYLEGQALHPYVGFVFDPESDTVEQMRSEWGWKISDLGFPEERTSSGPPPDDAVIVGIFGGSVATIQAVNGKFIVEALAELGAFPGRPIAVLGAAMPGFKQPQQLMTLNWLLATGQRFDIVVNLDGFNEVALPSTENLPEGVHLSYPRGWRVRAADTVDPEVTTLAGEIAVDQRRRSTTAGRFSRLPWRASVTTNLVWRLFDRRLEHQVAAARLDLEELGSRQYRMLTHGPRRAEGDAPADLAEMVELWRRSSLVMHQVCAGAGIAYHHMLQPNQYVPESKILTKKELRQGFDPDHRYRKTVVEGFPLLREAGRQLEQAGVRFTDLTMLFAGVEASVYHDTCCHFNLLGNQMLAQAVAEVIAADQGMARDHRSVSPDSKPSVKIPLHS